MKIKKNGKVVNLTESDLKRIVKRTLTEGESYSELEKSSDGGGGGLPKRCSPNELDPMVDKILVITSPKGVCGCKKEDFFN